MNIMEVKSDYLRGPLPELGREMETFCAVEIDFRVFIIIFNKTSPVMDEPRCDSRDFHGDPDSAL
jgi:hypothetical protein